MTFVQLHSSDSPRSSLAIAESMTEETKEMVSICYITGEGGTLASPRLCLHLHRNEAVVSRVAQQLLDHCLEKVPDAPARKEVGRGSKFFDFQ